MDFFRQEALMSVGKFCGLYSFATLFIMATLSFDASLSFRIGALLTIALSALLLFKAWRAQNSDLKGQQLWLTVAQDDESQKSKSNRRLQVRAFGEACYYFSKLTMGSACFLWVASLIAAAVE